MNLLDEHLTGEIETSGQAPLEKALLQKFLKRRGYQLVDIPNLPEDVAKKLMTEASSYASLQMAKIESRAGLRQKIHQPD